MNTRRNDIDMLKGLSIIAVVLYHIGILSSGYLGVDAFFVISGFLTIPAIVRKLEKDDFSYFKYILDKVIRFLPSILIAAVVALAFGYVFFLPDDYENLSQSIIASTFFSNNILSAITTKNYWDTVNEFKPFMHMWYLGILMEFYIVTPIIIMLIKKATKKAGEDFKKLVSIVISVLAILSLILFLLPQFSTGDKFYFLPFRYFELVLGGIVGLHIKKLNNNILKKFKWASLIIIVALFVVGLVGFDWTTMNNEAIVIGGSNLAKNQLLIPNNVLVIVTVIATSVFLISDGGCGLLNRESILSKIGIRSFSIYVWHQVMLALYRSSVSNEITILFVIIFLIVMALVSELNFRLVEKRIHPGKKSYICVLVCSFIVLCASGVVYLKAGVMRDVPELNIYLNSGNKISHATYCDRIYNYDKDFSQDDKIKVLVIGNSFARDFGNILLESEYKDKIDLSYSFDFEEELVGRISRADKIFIFNKYDSVPEFVWENAKSEDNIYGIGTKNFGPNNGSIYSRRFFADYHSQTAEYDLGYKKANDELKKAWGDNYIDMMEPVLLGGRVRIFTDENKFISQDCRHLTEAGAIYYANNLDIKYLLEG